MNDLLYIMFHVKHEIGVMRMNMTECKGTVIDRIDIKHDKNLSFMLNLYCFFLGLILLMIGNKVILLRSLFDGSIIGILFVIMGVTLSMYIHEYIQYIYVKHRLKLPVDIVRYNIFLKVNVQYNYFDRTSGISFLLLPVIILTAVNILLLIIFPITYFWIFYSIIIFNITNSVWNIHIVWRFLKLPKTTLLKEYHNIVEFYELEKESPEVKS